MPRAATPIIAISKPACVLTPVFVEDEVVALFFVGDEAFSVYAACLEVSWIYASKAFIVSS